MHARVASASGPEDDTVRKQLKHLNANLGHAAIRDPQSARGAKGKIENAVANPGTAVDDPHYHGLGAGKINYANSCAEWQGAVSCGHSISIEGGSAGCFAL